MNLKKPIELLKKKCRDFGDFLRNRNKIGQFEITQFSEYGIKMNFGDLGTVKFYINNKLEIKIVNQNLSEDIFEKILILWEIFKNGEEYLKGVHVFVDGSFMDGKIGYGFLVIKDGVILKKSFGRLGIEYSRYFNLRNVLGEIKAIIKAVEFCMEKGLTEIHIHYDYEGLKKWATLEWKAKNEITYQYQKYILGVSKKLKITWLKEKAHSDSMLNAFVDRLAKKALKQS